MSPACLIHWDDVERVRWRLGPQDAAWQRLGESAGSVGVGLRRIEIEPGARPTPAHRHGAEEEFFFVLRGAGLSWQDGTTYELAAGDCVLHRASREAHTLVGGPEGLDVLTFGPRRDGFLTVLPYAGIAWVQDDWVEIAGGQTPWEREVAAGGLDVPPPSPRPANILALADVPANTTERGRFSYTRRDFGDAMGSVATGLGHLTVAPGRRLYPHHCHSAEEEVFVVRSGDGLLRLGDAEHPVRAGHVLARPPGTGVAHSFTAGSDGLELLAYGTREPNDIAYYPDSNKVSLRGVGVMGRIERLDYWEGEE
jgi:uncharacterized cupin superfamily protein